MINTLKRSSYKNGYLLITAAWLYTLSFIFINYWSYSSSPARVEQRLENYIQQNEADFTSFCNDTVLLKGVLKQKIGNAHLQWFEEEQPGIFVYRVSEGDQYQLSYWNSHKVAPAPKDLRRPDGKYLVQYPSGEFELIKQTKTVANTRLVIIALVTIRWNYFFKNSYLTTVFPAIKNLDDQYELLPNGGDIEIKNGDGKVLFGLKQHERKKEHYDVYSLTLRVLSLIFILIFLNASALDFAKRFNGLKAFISLALVVFLLRFLSYHFPFPFSYRQSELFDPIIYASNTIHPSLGDLLINIILLFWLVSFFKMNCVDVISKLKPVAQRWQLPVMLGLAGLMVLFSFVAAGVIRSLIVDSQISFDISNFFSLSIYTFVSFLILCFITLTFFHLSHIIQMLLKHLVQLPWYVQYLAVAFMGLVYLSLTLPSSFMASNLFTLGWLMLYLYVLHLRPEDLYKPLVRSSFFLVWLVFFAGSISALIIYENGLVELQLRKYKADELAVQTDPSGQNILSITFININQSFLSENFNRLQNSAGNKFIKDSLISESFSGYINKYDTKIFTYDNNFKSLYNEDSLSYEVLTNIITNRSKGTGMPDVYYHENTFGGFSYILQKILKDEEGNILGYFFLWAKPKRYQSDALTPELFKEVKNNVSDLGENYSTAVYDEGKLMQHTGNYNFISQLPGIKWRRQEFLQERAGPYNILWYNAGNNKVVVVIRKGSIVFELTTLFAYLFGSFLFILITFYVGNLLLQSRFRWREIRSNFRFSIQKQIQSTILFISVFSFVIIGSVTISFYISRFENTKKERLSTAIQIMAKEIEKQVSARELADDVVKIYDQGASNQLVKSINDISEIHDVDVNFYDLAGKLKVSTQSYVYDKQVLSNVMEPNAFYRLHNKHEIQVIQEEHVGRFSYLSVYVPVNNDKGIPYAYINIPYLNSSNDLKQEISNFLVTLINLNAFIFVLAGVIAVLLTNRITRSLTLIGAKMRDINLGAINQEIAWNSKDEIGALVIEYNKMVNKLHESAQALAKSEREGAWREMARQVAHEIKNPLTPMKLSIQYLQRAIAEKKSGIQELSQKVAATLVEQIDQLAKIASDFSQFANIEHAKNEVFNVGDVLQSLMALYSANEQIHLRWIKPTIPTHILADKTQVIRLFTNLLQNAIEASSHKMHSNILITQSIDEGDVLISIADEGIGIPEEMHDKIFTPNFTTKSSGTGLGLAISKGIVEKAKGAIWFTTNMEQGTTFYVSFPLALKQV